LGLFYYSFDMKTIIIGTILYFVIQSKENCGGYYRYNGKNDSLEYTIFSSVEYNVSDTLYVNGK
jgi:hypothetical protein